MPLRGEVLELKSVDHQWCAGKRQGDLAVNCFDLGGASDRIDDRHFVGDGGEGHFAVGFPVIDPRFQMDETGRFL